MCAEHKKPIKLSKHLAAIKAQSTMMRNPPRVLVFANRVKVGGCRGMGTGAGGGRAVSKGIRRAGRHLPGPATLQGIPHGKCMCCSCNQGALAAYSALCAQSPVRRAAGARRHDAPTAFFGQWVPPAGYCRPTSSTSPWETC